MEFLLNTCLTIMSMTQVLSSALSAQVCVREKGGARESARERDRESESEGEREGEREGEKEGVIERQSEK